MEVAKTFDRDGVRYRPGDPLPPDLDKQALDHYLRHGMVREAKPQEAKPAGPRSRAVAAPKQNKPASPAHTAEGAQIQLDQELQQKTPEGHAADQSTADDASAADASATADQQESSKD